MRIAVLLKDRCKSKNCSRECIKFCPRVRAGDETVVMGSEGKPIISEELCVGCGICIHKCPYDAIKIIGLAQELETDLVHQFGKNGFRLFRLPIPKAGSCTGTDYFIEPTTLHNIFAKIAGISTEDRIYKSLQKQARAKPDTTATQKWQLGHNYRHTPPAAERCGF